MKPKIKPRREYNFEQLKPGEFRTIRIPDNDPRAGLRALSAAYNFARRHNDGIRKALHIEFKGRTTSSGKTMHIHRVR